MDNHIIPASIEEVLADPLEYQLQFDCCGWTISKLGSSTCLLITTTKAARFINAMKKA